eukprot:2120165-Rhodomonas_salina.2
MGSGHGRSTAVSDTHPSRGCSQPRALSAPLHTSARRVPDSDCHLWKLPNAAVQYSFGVPEVLARSSISTTSRESADAVEGGMCERVTARQPETVRVRSVRARLQLQHRNPPWGPELVIGT